MSAREARGPNAGAAVRQALQDAMGPDAIDGLAIAQVRLAWSELMAEAGLERGPFSSRVLRVTGGTVHVEASESGLAQELTLRADALAWAINDRMKGRPGATILVVGIVVTVGRIGS